MFYISLILFILFLFLQYFYFDTAKLPKALVNIIGIPVLSLAWKIITEWVHSQGRRGQREVIKAIGIQLPPQSSPLGPGGENGSLTLTWEKELVSLPGSVELYLWALLSILWPLPNVLSYFYCCFFLKFSLEWVSHWTQRSHPILYQCWKNQPYSFKHLTVSSYKTQIIVKELLPLKKKSYCIPLYFLSSSFFWEGICLWER